MLIGFQEAETAKERWKAPETREPVLPPRLFKTRTTSAILVSVFIQAATFFAASNYAPLYFQILGSGATMAGVRQLPLSLGASLIAMMSGIIVSKTGRYRPVMWVGWAVMTLGIGLLIMLDEDTVVWKQEIWLLVAGIGVGCPFQPPLIRLQASMPLKDMATSTAAFGLLRFVRPSTS